MKIRPLFAWYDFWIGAYVDCAKRRLFIFPVPMVGLMIDVSDLHWDEYRYNSNDDRPVFFIKRLITLFGCVIQLHRFISADNPGCFHSHPAWAIRIILWGGYVEETVDGRWRTFFPGRVGVVRPEFKHRIGGLRNGKSSWSLWLRGPKVRDIETEGC